MLFLIIDCSALLIFKFHKKMKIILKSPRQVEYSHPNAQNRYKRTQPISYDSCTSNYTSESTFMVFNEIGPCSPNVRSSTDKEQDYNYHAVEAKESALNE